MVGINSYNIDDTNDGWRPVYMVLLGAGIPIVEPMCNLEQLPVNGFTLTSTPVKVKGMGTFPVRAFATASTPEPLSSAPSSRSHRRILANAS
jgi:arylformamidase